MILSLIVAAAENNVIGKDNKLPWHLPDDLKRFRQLTKGKTVIMGRKTFESIGRPLPERQNIVVSGTIEKVPAGIVLVRSLDEALRRAGGEEVFVIGGAGLFKEASTKADRLYLTRVHAMIEGDVYFPAIDVSSWHVQSSVEHPADAIHTYPFTFIDYTRL